MFFFLFSYLCSPAYQEPFFRKPVDTLLLMLTVDVVLLSRIAGPVLGPWIWGGRALGLTPVSPIWARLLAAAHITQFRDSYRYVVPFTYWVESVYKNRQFSVLIHLIALE